MGIFSRSSDRNGQFSVLFMLLHFVVYFSTVSFHSISVSFSHSPSLVLPFIVWTCQCMEYILLHALVYLFVHFAFYPFVFSLFHLQNRVVAQARAPSCFSYYEHTKPSNLINCCHPRPEKVYFKQHSDLFPFACDKLWKCAFLSSQKLLLLDFVWFCVCVFFYRRLVYVCVAFFHFALAMVSFSLVLFLVVQNMIVYSSIEFSPDKMTTCICCQIMARLLPHQTLCIKYCLHRNKMMCVCVCAFGKCVHCSSYYYKIVVCVCVFWVANGNIR